MDSDGRQHLDDAKKEEDGSHSTKDGNLLDVDDQLLTPYGYICQAPGKNVRTKLAMAFNYWLCIPEDLLTRIAHIIQMLHNASLLIDDIEDSSELRRGIPVAHHVYGVPLTLNAANFVYFKALSLALKLGIDQHQEATVTHIFTEQMLELHRGQGLDIYWRDTYTCPTEEQYLQMVVRKTGGLFGLAVRLMQLFSTRQDVDFKPLLDDLGLLFQIRDDYANLTDTNYHAAKSYCEDLSEGKYSFPVVHAIQTFSGGEANGGNVVAAILRQRTKDNDVKRHCVDQMRQLGSFVYTRQVLLRLERRCLQFIENMGGNPLLVDLIDKLRQLYAGATESLASSSASH